MADRKFEDIEQHIEEELNGQTTEQVVRSTAKDVKRLMHLMYGNGDPTHGWIVRFDRLERDIGVARWMVGIFIVAYVGILVSIIVNAGRVI